MKKTTKGAIAAGAAAVLLAGGAGSFAAWNASTNTTGSGNITAGSMSITEKAGATGWTWADGTEFDAANHRLVPGDTVKYTATYEVELNGTNLEAKLVPNLSGLSGDLVEFLDVAPASNSVQTINSSGDVTFTTEVTFKDLEDQGVYGKNETASLAGGTITLEQVIN